MASETERIPVDIVTGMKCAGKTTLLNGLLEGPYRNERISLFTNELGTVPYPDGCQVHAVLGGCICCTAQTELIDEIRRAICTEAPERILIEMSGMGSVRDILQIFSYLEECRLGQLLYVLDIRKWRALAAVMGGFSQQIRSAPILFFSHWDETTQEIRASVLADLRRWNPAALVVTDWSRLDPQKNEAHCRAFLSGGPVRQEAPLETSDPGLPWRTRMPSAPPTGFKHKIGYKSVVKTDRT